jgi:hypothetical protein
MKLIKIFVVVAALILPLIAAGDANPPMVNPPESGLKIATVNDDGVSFTGQIRISGTLHVQWLASAAKPLDSTAILKASVELDKAALEHMPHFGNDNAPEVWIDNPEQAVRVAFDKVTATRILDKKMKMAEVHGQFVLKDLAIGECGSPWASATLVTASDQQKATFTQSWEFGDC